jgi:hypothetical protein
MHQESVCIVFMQGEKEAFIVYTILLFHALGLPCAYV